MAKITTGISQTFWCSLDQNGHAQYEPAEICIGEGKAERNSWFDVLFRGAIVLPDKSPLTLLVTGPPGSGKSTLTMELCYRLSLGGAIPGQRAMSTLYISADSETDPLIKNAKSFGWEEVDSKIIALGKGDKPIAPAVAVWGKDKIKKWTVLSEIVGMALMTVAKWGKVAVPEEVRKNVVKKIDEKPTENRVRGEYHPEILVIDSLNIIEPEQRGKYFQKYLKAAPKNTKIIIFILDSSSAGGEHRFWEYACDTVIRLDHTDYRHYYVRTIEVQKARYQEHVWGQQQLKIYSRFDVPDKPDARVLKKDDYAKEKENRNTKLRRGHPYHEEGGIFLFPSIHYYLSGYKRLAPRQIPQKADTIPRQLDEILVGGYPEGRCAAFIGSRGAHKSHLGYVHLLHRIINYDEGGLIVSLRDDEGMTKSTMQRIIEHEFPNQVNPLKLLNDCEKDNRLEILYYPPGYITPEEFFHRMFLSIQRLKQRDVKLTLLFNSLDQLSPRFPLCASQEILIPGIIESTSAEGVTSIFIAVEEPGQPAEQYGLLAMADLILDFQLCKFRFEDYFGHLDEAIDFKKKEEAVRNEIMRIQGDSRGSYCEKVVCKVVRYAGGQAAGAAGLLELVDDVKNQPFYDNAGLNFTLFSPKYSEGELL